MRNIRRPRWSRNAFPDECIPRCKIRRVCTFETYGQHESQGKLTNIRKVTITYCDPVKEFVVICDLREYTSDILCAGFLLAHCICRRYLTKLKRSGRYDEFVEELQRAGSKLVYTITGCGNPHASVILTCARQWLEYRNVTRDMSFCYAAHIASFDRVYSITDEVPNRSGIMYAEACTRTHDITKPEVVGSLDVNDALAKAMAQAFIAMVDWRSKIAVVHIATCTRSVSLLERLAVSRPNLTQQTKLDDWLINNATFHVKPVSADLESRRAMCFPTDHKHYVGRGFAAILNVFSRISADIGFSAFTALTRQALPSVGEFLTCHYIINLCWCSSVVGTSGTCKPVLFNTLRRFENLLQSSSFEFRAEAKHIVSRRLTSEFAVAFLEQPVHLDTPVFIKNPFGHRPPMHLEDKSICEHFHQVYHGFVALQWPVKCTVSGFGETEEFELSSCCFSAFNGLVNSCMCEKIRRAMADIGMQQRRLEINNLYLHIFHFFVVRLCVCVCVCV